MSIEAIKETIPDYAKDIRINIGRVLTEENSKGLTLKQIYGIALSSAYATKDTNLVSHVKELTQSELGNDDCTGIKSAATIMAMNNVYYRTVGMLSDQTFTHLQTGLRMQVIGKPGIPKEDFELYSLAVSAINGCQHCVDSHAKILMNSGISQEGIQSTIRIASVVYALYQINSIEEKED